MQDGSQSDRATGGGGPGIGGRGGLPPQGLFSFVFSSVSFFCHLLPLLCLADLGRRGSGCSSITLCSLGHAGYGHEEKAAAAMALRAACSGVANKRRTITQCYGKVVYKCCSFFPQRPEIPFSHRGITVYQTFDSRFLLYFMLDFRT